MNIGDYLLAELPPGPFPYCREPQCHGLGHPTETAVVSHAGGETERLSFVLLASAHRHATRDGYLVPNNYEIHGAPAAGITPTALAQYLRLLADHVEATFDKQLAELLDPAT